MNNKLYPIKFIPQARERVWGGNYFAKHLNKEYNPKENIGESWEIWSLFGESSEVSNGFLEGNTLDEIIETYLGDMVGDQVFQYYLGEFPLLVKFLDIKDRLSVQVHPNDEVAFEREGSRGKSECWYIMHADKDARIYMGFNKDVTPQEVYEKAKNGTMEEILNSYTPKVGDLIYIEPGCVHSAKGNIVLAEIQESSDITYRIYDWGRENDPKSARRMDLEDAIDIIDYKKYDKEKYYFSGVNTGGDKVLINSKNFIIKSIELNEPKRVFPSLLNSFIIYICIEGNANIKTTNGDNYSINKGECIMVPAGMEDFLLESSSKENPFLLEVYMPIISDEEDSYINDNN